MVSTKIMCGNKKLGRFLYVLQILQISKYTVETLQKYTLTSGFMRKETLLVSIGPSKSYISVR
jgi:hypothetical protein